MAETTAGPAAAVAYVRAHLAGDTDGTMAIERTVDLADLVDSLTALVVAVGTLAFGAAGSFDAELAVWQARAVEAGGVW